MARPRLSVPVALVRRPPRALTGVAPEGLPLLSGDRYATASADRLSRAAGPARPPVEQVLRRRASRLVDEDFGRVPARTRPAAAERPGPGRPFAR
ncbi:hypothetical protein ACOQFV_06930 [Nocardiopsis changdeensis]|uniref:Uncharacterized protein n=1 Tax=Nocardiopsis changdeensis TaxID=2831969 RepID=A0ABX8BR48_9ACTN|nr:MULTISPECIES: hypothetical protein [Nocardiopsis]QUX23572.1 hypothetical protein KGD84_04160 [Nocardiopsis changdeensis]QYX39516.1 hypothetical protein K1J57_13615 [Nocardiopsis sp. MT53]